MSINNKIVFSLACLSLLAIFTTQGMKKKDETYDFYKAIEACDVKKVNDMLEKDPALINKKYLITNLFGGDVKKTAAWISDVVGKDHARLYPHGQLYYDSPLQFLINLLLHELIEEIEEQERYEVHSENLENAMLQMINFMRPYESIQKNELKQLCYLGLLSNFLENSEIVLDKNDISIFQKLLSFLFNKILSSPDSEQGKMVLKVLGLVLANKSLLRLIDVSKPVNEIAELPNNAPPLLLEDILIFYNKIFKEKKDVFRSNNLFAIKAFLKHPDFDASQKDGKKWAPFFDEVLRNGDRQLISLIYKVFQGQSWFKNMNNYPIFRLFGDLIPQGKISRKIAKEFLLFNLKKKRQQASKPEELAEEFLEELLQEERISKLSDELKPIQQAYILAKQQNFKEIGSQILQYMTTLTSVVGKTGDYSEDIKRNIASYV